MTRPESWFSRRQPVAWLRAHPYAADGMLSALMAALAVYGLWQPQHDGGNALLYRDPNALAVLLALLSTAPLVWRRTHPQAVLSVTGTFAILLAVGKYNQPSGGLGVLIAIYSVAAHVTNRRRSQIALGMTLVGMFISLHALASRLPPNLLISNTIIFVTGWVLGDNLQTRRRYVGELELKAERLERDRSEDAQKAVAQERSRIARELHDVVAHNVSVMVVQAGGARRTMDKDPARARAAIESIEATGRQALTEMRRLLGVLRADDEATDSLSPQPGVSRLDDLVQHVRTAGLPVSVCVEGEPVALAAGVDLSAYRIVQEALTNALKHAGPASAEVFLRYGDRDLELRVRDNGRGAAAALNGNGQPADTIGHGIAGMRERVSLFGGALHAGPRAGGGYEIVATLPLEAGAE